MIWIIDDSVQHREGLSKLLRSEGYRVREFNGSIDVQNALPDATVPDVVIMDLALRGPHNGFALADLMILEARLNPGKFVFITGWSTQFSAVLPPQFRSNAVIDKGDWTLEEICDAIAGSLE